jgi:hypothetical protein
MAASIMPHRPPYISSIIRIFLSSDRICGHLLSSEIKSALRCRSRRAHERSLSLCDQASIEAKFGVRHRWHNIGPRSSRHVAIVSGGDVARQRNERTFSGNLRHPRSSLKSIPTFSIRRLAQKVRITKPATYKYLNSKGAVAERLKAAVC